jgi:hypothetical protein
MSPVSTKEARRSIAEKFGLTPPDAFSQHWEDEISVPGRIEELLKGYSAGKLNDPEKKSLMAIILNSYTELDHTESRSNEVWEMLLPLLKGDGELLSGLIAYYADPGNAEEDSFPFAGRLRAAFPAIVEAALKAETEE